MNNLPTILKPIGIAFLARKSAELAAQNAVLES